MTVPNRPVPADRSEGAFDRALARAARSLVLAPLPAAILDAPRPAGTRRWLHVDTVLAAAAAIVVLALGIAIGVPTGPGAGRAPVLRGGIEISRDLGVSGYSCRPGAVASPGEPRMEAVVCAATVGPVAAAVIVSEDSAGRVGEIHIKSDIVGTPSATAERNRIDLLQRLIGVPIANPSDAAAVRDWVADQLPLDPGRTVRTTIDGLPIVLERVARGGYLLVLGDLEAGGSAAQSR